MVFGYELAPMGNQAEPTLKASYNDFHHIKKLGKGATGHVNCVAYTGGVYKDEMEVDAERGGNGRSVRRICPVLRPKLSPTAVQ